MSLRNSLHNFKSTGSARRRFFRGVWLCFVAIGMLSAFAGFSSITGFLAIKASAQTQVDKSQVTPTPTTLPDLLEPNALIWILLGMGALGAAAARRRHVPMKSDTVQKLDEILKKIITNAKRKEPEKVLCTVFTPDHVAQGDAFLVQAFAHVAQLAPMLKKIAKQADLTATKRGSEKLGTIKLKQQLGFYLEMPGLEIDEPAQSLVWNGQIESLKFGVTVPPTFGPRSIICKLSVSRHNVPIGHIRFSLRISAALRAKVDDNKLKVHQEFVRYRLAFISYASTDRSEVLKRVQMLDLVKVTYFQDLLNLEAGQRWEPLIYSYIDNCDVFYLFWSSAAKKSKWVRKEVKHALKRKGDKLDGPPEIMPIPIEGPPPVKPPRYLSAIHFDSRFLYFINPKENNTPEPRELDSNIPKDIN